jgi:hypothetical protein
MPRKSENSSLHPLSLCASDRDRQSLCSIERTGTLRSVEKIFVASPLVSARHPSEQPPITGPRNDGSASPGRKHNRRTGLFNYVQLVCVKLIVTQYRRSSLTQQRSARRRSRPAGNVMATPWGGHYVDEQDRRERPSEHQRRLSSRSGPRASTTAHTHLLMRISPLMPSLVIRHFSAGSPQQQDNERSRDRENSKHRDTLWPSVGALQGYRHRR